MITKKMGKKMSVREQKNLEKELIEYAEKSYAHDKIEAICYGGMRHYKKPKREEYAFLTKLFGSDEDWIKFEERVRMLELHLFNKYHKFVPIEALPFWGEYQKHFRKCIYAKSN